MGISAVLIVRDEEAHLAACLRSVAELVNEIVVVDTGSRDRSVEVAAEHGARVVHEPWRNDFSKPRNLGLDEAAEDWILYLDADERVIRCGELAPVLADRALIAGLVEFSASSRLTPYLEFRLFRNRDDLRFRSPIHETVVPDLERIMAAGELGCRPVPLAIQHLGYEGDLRAKHERNLPMLLQAVELDPERVYLWHALGEARVGLGAYSEGETAWRRGLEALRARPVRAGDALLFGDLLDLHFSAEGPRLVDAADLWREGWDRAPCDPLLLWWGARLASEEGRQTAARFFLDQLLAEEVPRLAVHGLGYDKRLFGEFAWGLYGATFLVEGAWSRALSWLRKAEAANPGNVEIRAKRVLAEAGAAGNRPGR